MSKEEIEKAVEEIDVFELAEKLMGSQSIEASVWIIKEYASQEREKGVIEGFNAAKIIVEVGAENQPLYPTATDYLNSKNKP